MFGLRRTTDAQARDSSGQPAPSTTGVASSAWIHGRPGASSAMSMINSGSASAAAIQNRRVMSRSSGLGAPSAIGWRGSSAMPQMGQGPG